MKILVTGATGCIGRHVAAMATAAGHHVVASGRTAAEGPWASFVAADLRDEKRTAALVRENEPDVVFHLAGLVRGSEAELTAANTAPVGFLCDAIAARGPRTRLVLAGSSAEYGQTRGEAPPFTESATCAPETAYGRSKLRATERALTAAGSGVDVRIVRASNVLGAGLSDRLVAGSLVNQLAGCLRQGRAFAVRAGALTAQRDFVDAEDLARAWLALATYRGTHRVFNVAAGECFPVRTIVDILQHEVGEPIDVHRDPALGTQSAPADRVAISPALAAAELGFRRHVSLRESIARMWQTAIADIPVPMLRPELAT